MSEERWGMCAAYGCPLAGSLGSEGRWYCYCHANKPSVENDRITQVLRDDYDWLVQSTLEIRGKRGTKDWPGIYRNIQQRLIRADRSDLLLCEKDESPHKPGYRNTTIWLMRLERELIEATDSGNVKKISNAVPTAPVVGPTHAMEHYTEKT
jgi:hypothetical protein